MTVKLWTRRMNDQPWTFYGEFKTEQAFKDELPHIRAQGLSIKRTVHSTNRSPQ